MGSFCNYANSGFAFLNCFFLAWSTYSKTSCTCQKALRILLASSMTNGAWTRGEFVTCFRPPHVNWIRAKFGEEIEWCKVLCVVVILLWRRCSKIIPPEKLNSKMSVGTWNWKVCVIHMMPLTRFYTHGCLLLFLSFARVAECLWRSSWNWASVALTFASLREIMLSSTMKGSYLRQCSYEPFLKPTRKYAYGGAASRDLCLQISKSTMQQQQTFMLSFRFYPRNRHHMHCS